MIPQQKIEEIINAASVEDVVGEVVHLKKRGVNLLGLCPFHNEKTPSFTVSPAKGIYKCFGCGKAGNAVNFLMEHDGLGYIEALRNLAEKYNIEWPKQENVNIDEERKLKSEKESLQILNNYALNYFENLLWNNEEGQDIGYAYFIERGFRDDIIKKFKLGYSLNQWDNLFTAAINMQFNETLILKSGLVKENESGKKYDAYRGRVIFPIHNINGKVIAFAGRQLVKDTKSPKYVNSPETVLYYKSNELYGLYYAKNAIRQKDFCYLVEGYTDVITLHQAGIENVVASSGTSLTDGQIKLIKRQTDNVTVLYDGDAAGIKASMRGIDMLLEHGLNVKVVLFPDGEDPDSYCKKVGSAIFEDYLIKNSRDFILFKVQLLLNDSDNDPVKKATVSRDIVESISVIPDGLKRTAFIKECAILLKMPEQLLITELNKTRKNHLSAKEKEWIANSPEAGAPVNYEDDIKLLIDDYSQKNQEIQLIKLLILYGDKPIEGFESAAHYILNQIADDEIDFETETSNLILQEVKNLLHQGLVVNTAYFVNHANPLISGMAAGIIASPYTYSEMWEKRFDILLTLPDENYLKEINSSLLHLKLRNTNKLLKHVLKEIETSQLQNNDEMIRINQYMHIELKQKSSSIAHQIGAVVIH